MPPVDDLVKLCIIFSIFVLPALALTTRFALKPIVDAILRLKEGGVISGGQPAVAASQDIALLAGEIRQMRDEMAQLQQSVAQLQDVDSFHRALAEPAARPQIGPSSEA